MAGRISAGHLGQTVVYVIILASAFAVLGEVYGDLLRAAGATERLMELLASRRPLRRRPNRRCRPLPRRAALSASSDVTFHYPSRPTQAALRDFTSTVAAGRNRGAGGPQRRRQKHGVPAAAALLRSAAAAHRARRRAARELALDDLRQRIGIVPQDAVIFSSSALENIRYGKPEASDAEVDRGRPGRLCRTSSSPPCRRATTPSWASAACACPAASASASPLPAPC